MMTATTSSMQAVATERRRSRSIRWSVIVRSAVVTLVTAFLAFLFLLPFFNMVFTSLKTTAQMMQPGAPVWPAIPGVFEYEGKELELYLVPLEDGSVRELAIVRKGRQQSTFIDPDHPEAGEIEWSGSWRALQRPWQLHPAWGNYREAWEKIDFPILFRNTLAIALIGLTGTVISSTLVAYGFARFRFPGRGFLFTLLLSTIFLPAAVTIVPTYAFFVAIGWVGTWLPLTVPHFFSNAYNVFLLRQYMLTIPREIDEAAQMDGANPFRILISILLPQCAPVVLAVALFHLVFAWNDYFGPLLYLSTRFDLQPIAVALPRFNNLYGSNPPLIQAASLMAMALPVLLFFLAQRVFMQGVVITGVEK
ncbi:carbohydrate ABC transporter permease [Caldilinea sp.]|jgi:multiple sugar transport system permease protein|uniref:carbohydrate ABC transporter permease n=1 Tax=Caldilinea sp. TaxID=2293560 RepID=UPI00261E853E|nr:carbohydrate ABC transporter permease [uncultured Caldilinea sp.]